MTSNTYDAIIIGGGVSGDKSPAQCMKALRAGASNEGLRVCLSGLPRTEVGIYPAEHHRQHAPAKVVKLPFYEPEWKKK